MTGCATAELLFRLMYVAAKAFRMTGESGTATTFINRMTTCATWRGRLLHFFGIQMIAVRKSAQTQLAQLLWEAHDLYCFGVGPNDFLFMTVETNWAGGRCA